MHWAELVRIGLILACIIGFAYAIITVLLGFFSGKGGD